MTDKYFTSPQVAQRLEVSLPTVYRLIESGELKAKKFGKRCIRIPVDALIEYERRANA